MLPTPILHDQVTVLESRDRIGGRVHTDYSFGCPIDMGASWLVALPCLELFITTTEDFPSVSSYLPFRWSLSNSGCTVYAVRIHWHH